MGLITKPPSWRACTTNLTGTPAAFNLMGTGVTAAANDTMGTAVTVLSALSHDVELLVIGFVDFGVTTGNGSALAHILIDRAGGTAWSTLIPFLICGQTTDTVFPQQLYSFPLWIPAGASVGIQAQTAHTSDLGAGQVYMWAYGANANPGSWWCGQSVTAIGIDSTISQGQNHTSGASGTYSSWTNLGSPLGAPCGAIQSTVHGGNVDTVQQNLTYLFEFGVGGQRIGAPVHRRTSTSEDGGTICPDLGFASLPAGAQLQVRGTSSAASPEVLDVAVYAVH